MRRTSFPNFSFLAPPEAEIIHTEVVAWYSAWRFDRRYCSAYGERTSSPISFKFDMLVEDIKSDHMSKFGLPTISKCWRKLTLENHTFRWWRQNGTSGERSLITSKRVMAERCNLAGRCTGNQDHVCQIWAQSVRGYRFRMLLIVVKFVQSKHRWWNYKPAFIKANTKEREMTVVSTTSGR